LKTFIKMSKKILFGVAPRDHILLAHDEIQGLKNIGYLCESTVYGRNDPAAKKLKKLLGVLFNALKIIKTLYRFSPDLLYLNSRFEPAASGRDFISIFLIKLLYLRRLKIVIKTHGSDISLINNNSFIFSKILVPFLIDKVDAWFFLSHEEKQLICSLKPKLAENIYVTANIIDPARSIQSKEFQKQFKLDSDKFKFIFVGRIIREKGVFSFLKSIPLLDFKDKCQFIFVGDGTDLNELKNLCIELNLSNLVHFLGHIPDNVCDHFYSNTDALVFPTYFDEGFPMALFKSVSAGLPVITTPIRAAKDYLVEPDNVLWVEGKSEQSVAKAMTTLFHNPELRKSMSANNRETGRQFSGPKVCEEMNRVLHSLI